MSNAAEEPDSRIPGESSANPYALRFRLPDHDGQLAGWVAQIDQRATVEELPSTAELRDLLEGKIRTPEERRARWGRVFILLVCLTAALYWLYLVRKYLLEMIAFG